MDVIFAGQFLSLHRVNLRWHPKGEQILWRPDLQEFKVSQASGDRVLRYEMGFKRRLVAEFKALFAGRMPYCRVRYAFCPSTLTQRTDATESVEPGGEERRCVE